MKQSTVFLLGFIVVAASVLFVGGRFPLDLSGGFATLSISNVAYTSNDASVSGPAWLITVSQNGGGQYISGTVSKEMLKDAAAGVQAADNVDIRMNLEEMFVQYPIQTQLTEPDYIYLVDKTMVSGFSSCPSDYPNYVTFGLLADNKYCFRYTKTAAYGLIGTPTLTFKTSISLSSGGKTATATISNIGAQTVKIVDPSSKNAGTITWAGNLGTGEETPRATDQKVSAAYVYTRNGWITISETDYQYYKTWRMSNFQTCMMNAKGNDASDKDYCVNTVNNLANQVLVGQNLVSSGGTAATTQGSQDAGQVRLELKKQIQFPVMTMKLSADWIGTITIVAPVGQPRIISVDSKEFQTGGNGFINVVVQNIGSGDGSFAIQASCSGAVSVQGTALNLPSLKPNEQTTMYIPISGNAVSTATETCSVKVYDRNNPDKSDTRTVTVTVNPVVLCTPNMKRANGNTVEQCNPDGSGWKTIQICRADEEPQRTVDGDVKCVKKTIEPPNWDPVGWLANLLKDPLAGVKDALASFGIIAILLLLGVATIYIVTRRRGVV